MFHVFIIPHEHTQVNCYFRFDKFCISIRSPYQNILCIVAQWNKSKRLRHQPSHPHSIKYKQSLLIRWILYVEQQQVSVYVDVFLTLAVYNYSDNPFTYCAAPGQLMNQIMKKKVREKSRECHNHKPQPFPDTKRKRKPTNPNKHKSIKRT